MPLPLNVDRSCCLAPAHAGSIPGDGSFEPFFDRSGRRESQSLARPGQVETAARLAVRLRSIKAQLAAKAGLLGDHLRQITNGDFTSGADVDRLGSVQVLSGEEDRPSRVLD